MLASPRDFVQPSSCVPSPGCVRAPGSEGMVPCTGEVRSGVQTTAAAPWDAADPKVLCSGKAGGSTGR